MVTTRLDLVAEGKFLVRRIIAGELTAAAADRELSQLERRTAPYPVWLRLAWGVQFGVTRWIGPTAGTFIAATLLAAAAGYLEIAASRPPRIVLILGGFFALTVGALALRGLTTIDGGFTIQGFNDIRDAITQTAALTLGLIVGATPAQAVFTSRVKRMAEAGRMSAPPR